MSTAGKDTQVIGYQVESDERLGEGGFLTIRRLRLRTVRGDGSVSPVFISDHVERDKGLDAVVVGLYYRDGAGQVRVLLRQGLRPALRFGRLPGKGPIDDAAPYLHLTEVVAGIIESGDQGQEGIRRRAAQEALEEAGFQVSPESVRLLGAPVFPTPGMSPERFYLTAVEVDPKRVGEAQGDGSPMEEGASQRFVPLDEAIALCAEGVVEDAKTELLLRRLRDALR